MHTRPRIGLVFALAAAIGCGSVTASPDASPGGTSGGGAGRGGSSAAGTTGTGGGTAGAPGGTTGTGRGGSGDAAGAGGMLTGAAGRGGAGGGLAGGPGTAGRGGTGGGLAGGPGTAGRGGTGGGLAGGPGTAGRGGTGGGNAGAAGTGGRGGTGGGLAGGPGNGGRGGTGIGGAAGRVPCQTDADCQLFKCCNSVCVNETNDIQNCGGCGKVCPGLHPFCDQGNCGAAPCNAGIACIGTEQCCGSQCCPASQLCCYLEVGPGTLRCSDPVLGTCPQGCISGCPCTAPTTPIATPTGDRPISELRAGDLVYSVHHGAFAVVPIKLVHRTAVAPTHEMVEARLAHGPVLRITPAHPTADGRTFGDLRRGDRLDGVRVESVRVVPYGGDFTYDILPDSDTGTYVAGGVLIGSALAAPVTGRVTVVDPARSSRRASLAPAPHHLTP